MPDSSDNHPLRQLALGIVEGLDGLEAEYPDLWTLTSFAANVGQALLVSVMDSRDLTSGDALPLLLTSSRATGHTRAHDGIERRQSDGVCRHG